MEQNKKGDTGGWVQWSVLVDRLRNEYTKVSGESVPVLASRYLKNALVDGYVDREKKGRKVFYRVTVDGSAFLISRRDQLDDMVRWYETPTGVGLMSFAVAPEGAPLIGETRDEDSFSGVEEVELFMRRIKEKNPNLRSLYLRFG